jgi:hypothetical protein
MGSHSLFDLRSELGLGKKPCGFRTYLIYGERNHEEGLLLVKKLFLRHLKSE